MDLIIPKIILVVNLLIKIIFCLECKSNIRLVFEKNSTTHHILGCEIENWNGDKSTAFRGIRYAKPPIDSLRFKDPQPIQEIPSFQDARHDGHDCSSIFSENSSEDCLFLNIYAKAMLPFNNLRPVIIFIHPGGLYLGSGASSFLGPEYLLIKDVIIVTFNHRLGSMGFLNLGTSDIPGNAGFKDQVLALRWVNENIEYFGGDSNNITLMGYSAGAFSVCLHLVSPMSQGLFHKAIIMSGSIPPQTRIPQHNQVELAKRQSLLLGCKEPSLGSNIKSDILECLSQFSGFEISKTLRKMFYFGKDNPIYLWLPIIEEDFGQERFLIEDPGESFKFGRFAKVPILIGFSNGEFCTSAKDILVNETMFNQFTQNFEKLSPICFMYSEHKKEQAITQAIQVKYFDNKKMKFSTLCDLFSDSIIRFGAQRIATLASNYVNVYPYKFIFRGSASHLEFPGNNAVEHMDDLMYVFKMPLKHFSTNDPESKVIKNMVNLFTRFAENGKPDENFGLKLNKYAELDVNIEVRDGQYFEKYNFWENVTSN